MRTFVSAFAFVAAFASPAVALDCRDVTDRLVAEVARRTIEDGFAIEMPRAVLEFDREPVADRVAPCRWVVNTSFVLYQDQLSIRRALTFAFGQDAQGKWSAKTFEP